MFCEYCGKEIPEGGVCSCRTNTDTENAQQASDETKSVPKSEEQVSQALQASNSSAGSTQNNQSSGSSVDFNNIFDGLQEMVKLAFTKPASYVKASLEFENRYAQFAAGILYIIILFITPIIEINISAGRYAQYIPIFKISFFITLAVLLCRAVIAFTPVVAGKVPVIKMLGCVSALTVVFSLLRLLMGTLFVVKLQYPAYLLMFLTFFVSAAYDYEIMCSAFDDNKDKAFLFFVIAELIVLMVAYAVGYNGSKEILGAFMGM